VFNYTHHIFVCINQRPAGHPKGDCATKGSRDVFRKFQKRRRSASSGEGGGERSTCLGPCAVGANVVVYPEGVWYAKVTTSDVEEIMDQHVVGGKPVERLLLAKAMEQG